MFAVASDRGLLLDTWAGRTALAAQQRIGWALASMRDRVFGEYRIRSAGRDAKTGNAAYRLEKNHLGSRKTPETPKTPATNPQYLAAEGLTASGVLAVDASETPKTPPGAAKTPPFARCFEDKTPDRREAESPHGARPSGTGGGVSGVSGVFSRPPALQPKEILPKPRQCPFCGGGTEVFVFTVNGWWQCSVCHPPAPEEVVVLAQAAEE